MNLVLQSPTLQRADVDAVAELARPASIERIAESAFRLRDAHTHARLGLDYTLSNTLEIVGGRITGRLVGDLVDADAKARELVSLLQELRIPKQQSVAIGDGANDLKMMAAAGLSIAFRAKPLVRAKADCALAYSGLDGILNLFE